MIYSMTGFGRCELVSGLRKVTIELKSVNHRYLDVSVKMPKKFNVFENKIRNKLKDYAERGKVDIFIAYQDLSEGSVNVVLNEGIADEYMNIASKINDKYAVNNDLTATSLMRMPEVILMEDEDMDEAELWAFISEACDKAMSEFKEQRGMEGEKLKADILDKLDVLSENVAIIEERSPQIIEEYKKRLLDKIKEAVLNVQIDESRLAMEVTIYADKICVDEELVRLKSHIGAVKDTLNNGGAVGRRLDFLAQELNREANTILSKSTDVSTSDAAIEIKTGIEKIREQNKLKSKI